MDQVKVIECTRAEEGKLLPIYTVLNPLEGDEGLTAPVHLRVFYRVNDLIIRSDVLPIRVSNAKVCELPLFLFSNSFLMSTGSPLQPVYLSNGIVHFDIEVNLDNAGYASSDISKYLQLLFATRRG